MSLNLPIVVTSDCNVVDIFIKVKRWSTLVGLVVESPVCLIAEILQCCARNSQPRLNWY